MKVEDFLRDTRVKKLCLQAEFMTDWLYYEYYQIGEKVAKWSNYTTTKTRGNWNNYS